METSVDQQRKTLLNLTVRRLLAPCERLKIELVGRHLLVEVGITDLHIEQLLRQFLIRVTSRRGFFVAGRFSS